MVSEKIKGGKKYFVCDECGLAYNSRLLAEKCEAWCTKRHSCNTEIAKYSVKME